MTNTQPADTSTPDSVPQVRLTLLRQMLVTRFSVDELKTLCVDLGLEYAALPGEGKEGKARELVAYLERRDRIPELEEKSKRLRSDLSWEPEQPPPVHMVTRLPAPVQMPGALATINMQAAVDLFYELMQPDSPVRVLRLLGQPKLGKTHLVTRVFPDIARRVYHASCAVITMRKDQGAADILHAICSYLGGLEAFPTYRAAYEQAQNRVRAQVSGVQAFFSRIKVEAGADDPRKLGRDLVPPFVSDLRKQGERSFMLLFDAVNDASGTMQEWLTDTLVGQVSPLTHVRIVVAGRSVPEAHGSFAACCCDYELLPVEEEDAYITYCRQLGILLVEQSIRDIARLLDYKPGLFADHVLSKFWRREVAHG